MHTLLSDHNLVQMCEFYSDGQQVIDSVTKLVQNAIKEAESFPVKPIHALILDLNMPIKNGLDVIEEI